MVKDTQKAFPVMLEQQMEMARETQTKFKFMARSLEKLEKVLCKLAKGKMADQKVDEISAEILQLENKIEDKIDKVMNEIKLVGRETCEGVDKDKQEVQESITQETAKYGEESDEGSQVQLVGRKRSWI